MDAPRQRNLPLIGQIELKQSIQFRRSSACDRFVWVVLFWAALPSIKRNHFARPLSVSAWYCVCTVTSCSLVLRSSQELISFTTPSGEFYPLFMPKHSSCQPLLSLNFSNILIYPPILPKNSSSRLPQKTRAITSPSSSLEPNWRLPVELIYIKNQISLLSLEW